MGFGKFANTKWGKKLERNLKEFNLSWKNYPKKGKKSWAKTINLREMEFGKLPLANPQKE